MKHRQRTTQLLEQVDNSLTSLDSFISNGRPSYELKEAIEKIKEKLGDIQTLLNNESDSWS
jgi:archaellum component FlaC